MGTRFYSANENAIEFLRDEDRMTVTFSDPHFIAVVKRLAKKYPDQVEIMALPSNNGGYIYAHLPVSFLQVRFPGVQPALNEEQREMYSNMMKGINEKKNKAKEQEQK